MEEDRIGRNGDESVPNQCLKSSITVECLKMNESKFHGVINYTEAKEKIFVKALGLPINILSAVRMIYLKHPAVQFKLKNEIDISNLPSKLTIERKFHSGGILMTDKIHCQVLGIPKPEQVSANRMYMNNINRREAKSQNQQQSKPKSPNEEIHTVRINGIESKSDISKVKN